MNETIITKSIYELSKTESQIVNNTIKCFLKLFSLKHNIISIKVNFTARDYHQVLQEYTTIIIDNIDLETDLGNFKLSLYSDPFNQETSRYLIIDSNERAEYKGLIPKLKYFSRTYSLASVPIENYTFILN